MLNPVRPVDSNLRGRVLLFLALALLVAGSTRAATSVDAESALEGFDAWVEGVMEDWLVPGLGVAVVQDGELVFARGYGKRDLEAGLDADGDTLFAIGSNSKSFTATILGMLVDEGELEWDKPVIEYMPDFRLHDPVATAGLTPRDLVSHTSGLPRHDAVWYGADLTREEIFARLRYLEPSKSFREAFQYQNLMFMTAGLLAERITGQTWEELVEARLFEPLGMERSNFSVDAMAADPNHAVAHMDVDRVLEKIPFRNIDEIGPAGSINSSPAMMAKYVQFHLDNGKVGDEQLLEEATSRTMQSPQMVMTGPIAARSADPELGAPSYGLGLMVSSYRGHSHVMHGGGIDGFISAMEWLPQDDIGVVVLSNTSGQGGAVTTFVVRNVFDRLLGLEPIDWAGRAAEQRKQAEEMAAKVKAEADAARRQDTSPSHDLADYAGSYEHPAYGRVDVEIEGGALRMSRYDMQAPLEHYHYDIFTVPADLQGPASALAGLKARFDYDKAGNVNRLELPLEPAVGDIEFSRIADEAMSEAAFLERLVGEYELAGQVGTVAMKGSDTLTLSLPGQPQYTLVPKQGTSFSLKGLPGFLVEFKLPEGEGPAQSVVFQQPNGTFTATRKE